VWRCNATVLVMAFIPFIVLIVLITCCIAVFGNATLDGASQVTLLVASAVSVLVGHFSKRLEWSNLEKEISDKIASCTPAIIILLLIGAIGGTWMVAGIVPTMIYYGMQIIQPEIFLVSSSLLCALVSLMIGSSWTTVATGGALTATGQLEDLMRLVLRLARGTASLVATTVGTAFFCNIATADQYLSIMLSSSMFRDVYRRRGYEPQLLSRSCEDGATVTSVLVPWNTCGLTQSTVLGVATLTYLPYCFFNYLSPLVSIFVAGIGWNIKRTKHATS